MIDLVLIVCLNFCQSERERTVLAPVDDFVSLPLESHQDAGDS
jgi:hypothetical protein